MGSVTDIDRARRLHPSNWRQGLRLVSSQTAEKAPETSRDAKVLPMCPTSGEGATAPLTALTPDEMPAYLTAHPEVLARARQLAADHPDGAA